MNDIVQGRNRYHNGINEAIKEYMPEIYELYPKSLFGYAEQIPINSKLPIETQREMYQHIHSMTQDFIKEFADINNVDIPVRQYIDGKETIFIFWYQGFDSMPYIVKKCFESVKRHANGRNVILIDKDNIEDYVSIDENIKECLYKQTISITFFSDYLRCCLLEKYYGLWLDSTILVTKDIPDFMFENDLVLPIGHPYRQFRLFVRLFLDEYEYAPVVYVLGGKSSRLFALSKAIIEQYFKTHDKIVNYFFINDIIEFCIKNDADCYFAWMNCPENNKDCEMLNSACQNDVSELLMNKAMNSKTFLFKLTYRRNKASKNLERLLSL